MGFKYIIGIDEAGRGPLAGPVSVGAVLVPTHFDWELISGARDSKKMTHEAREAVYGVMRKQEVEGQLRFAVAFSAPERIDREGIVPSIRSALSRALSKLDADPGECRVLLDGGLKAPDIYLNQETIIRGDDSEPVISLASIAAKVLRDRYMVTLAKEHPQYGFELHKGYGTKLHMENMKKYGLCSVHRKTFCGL